MKLTVDVQRQFANGPLIQAASLPSVGTSFISTPTLGMPITPGVPTASTSYTVTQSGLSPPGRPVIRIRYC